MKKDNSSTLLQVLSSEQQILLRTDQKAFTLLSILGVFMVFFIIHFLKIQMNWLRFSLVLVYFGTAFMAIIYLVLVIVPRVKKSKEDEDEEEAKNIAEPFFGFISKFPNAEAYGNYLADISDDPDKTYSMFASQVFALATINRYKNQKLQRAIIYFALAITSELLIIMSMAWDRALPFLFVGT